MNHTWPTSCSCRSPLPSPPSVANTVPRGRHNAVEGLNWVIAAQCSGHASSSNCPRPRPSHSRTLITVPRSTQRRITDTPGLEDNQEWTLQKNFRPKTEGQRLQNTCCTDIKQLVYNILYKKELAILFLIFNHFDLLCFLFILIFSILLQSLLLLSFSEIIVWYPCILLVHVTHPKCFTSYCKSSFFLLHSLNPHLFYYLIINSSNINIFKILAYLIKSLVSLIYIFLGKIYILNADFVIAVQ